MGPDERLGELITQDGDRLLRLAYQLTHDRSAAEDVVQEALVNVFRMLRRKAVDDLPADRDALWRALGDLPTRRRAVLVLCVYGGSAGRGDRRACSPRSSVC